MFSSCLRLVKRKITDTRLNFWVPLSLHQMFTWWLCLSVSFFVWQLNERNYFHPNIHNVPPGLYMLHVIIILHTRRQRAEKICSRGGRVTSAEMLGYTVCAKPLTSLYNNNVLKKFKWIKIRCLFDQRQYWPENTFINVCQMKKILSSTNSLCTW